MNAQQRIDITAQLRSEIEKRDWAKCHIAGDRAKPIFLPLNWRKYR